MIALGIMQFISFRSTGQMTMPDHACTGETRHYYVIPGQVNGSTYTWWVDGNVMPEFNTSEFIYTWNSSKTYLLEVQERSADGCPGPKKSGQVFVNPQPEIQISVSDTMICDGERVNISVQNPSGLIWGKWIYDLIVEPEAGITGNSINSTYTSPTNLSETLFNNDKEVYKVVYRFIPGILTDDGIRSCEGKEVRITVWIHPMLRYNKEISDYNGFNISCHGKSDGFIRIDPTSETAPFKFKWSGPDGFTATSEGPEGLMAGQYMMTLTDRYMCQVTDTFNLSSPEQISMEINHQNIDCSGLETGSAVVSAINYVGDVIYLWDDGYEGSTRQNMPEGTYRIILTDSNNCQVDTTITLKNPDPLRIQFSVKDPFCKDSRDGEIIARITGGTTGEDYFYLWSDNSTGSNITGITEGWYSVTVTDRSGCALTDSVRLVGMNEICLIIPDAFSPNGDEINDTWNIENIDLYPGAELTVYNRWGKMIWQSELGYPVSWNGNCEGEVMPVDSYHYFIELHNGYRPIVGTVTIVR